MSLSSFVPFVRGEVLPATFSPPHLIVLPPSSVSCLRIPVFLLSCLPHISLLTQSSHLSLDLHRPLLPYSRNYVSLFSSLSSAVLSTCPAHCNLLLISLSVKLIRTPVSSLNSTILLLSALVTLAICRTQLFSHTCSICCCSSGSVQVSVPYRHTGVAQVLMTLPISFSRSAGPPPHPQLLSTRSPLPVLIDVPLSPSSRLHTLSLLGTRNCPAESVSPLQLDVQLFPLVAYVHHFLLV